MKFAHYFLALHLWGLAFSAVHGQGYNLLVGGGSIDSNCDLTDQHWADATYQWFVDRSKLSGPNGGNGRILIVDYETYSQCDQSNPGSFVGECAYFRCLGAVEADHVCVADGGGSGRSSCLNPDSDEVYDLILEYDGLWFRGGDQSRYVDNWKNTMTESAIHKVWSAGGVLGGTSAGAMIQSEVVSTGDAPSWEATGDPFQNSIQLTADFFAGPHAMLNETVVDSHFFTRARLGRLSVFLARLKQSVGISYLGIGVDAETGLAVYPDGTGQVLGEGSVSFIFPSSETEVKLEQRKPPYISNLETHILTEGFHFDLQSRVILTIPDSATPSGPFPSAPASQPTVINGAVEADRQKASLYISNPTTQDALWQDKLLLAEGTPGIDNGLATTNLEDSSALRENRAGGPLWGLKEQASQGLAVFTDGYSGSSCNAVQVHSGGSLTALAGKGCPREQSVVVVDCCGLEWVDQSPWDPDGDGKKRQSVALTPCRTTLWNSQLGASAYLPRCLNQGPAPFCGNGICDPGEDSCSCPEDCGPPPPVETNCSDEIDNDCDGLIDDEDPDCQADCLPAGSTCFVDQDCCSEKCVGRPGNRKCQSSGGRQFE